MPKAETTPEPTMEEILASIRQIISDDSDTPGSGSDDPKEPEAVSDTLSPDVSAEEKPPAEMSDEPEQSSAAAEAGGSEAVLLAPPGNEPEAEAALEDASGLQADGTGTSEQLDGSANADTSETAGHDDSSQIVDESSPHPADEAELPAGSLDSDDLDAHAVPAEGTSSADYEDSDAPPADGFGPDDPAGEEVILAPPPADETEVDESPTDEIQTQEPDIVTSTELARNEMPDLDEDDRNLLSADSDAAVSGAFSALAHTILAQNARTLEDLVSEMLQPMLKDWLDENLPGLVERMVRQEIERVSGGRR